MDKIRLAVFVSGRGSHLKNLIDYYKGPGAGIPVEIVLVVSDKPDAPALKYALEADIETLVTIDYPGKTIFAELIEPTLLEMQIDLIVLAGFMRILDADFVNRWENAIVNIHPSLLPEFPGLHPQRRALESGAKVSGCSVHYVIPEVDAGHVIGQITVPIEEGDTEDTLSARILKAEHLLYPLAVDLVAVTLLEKRGL